MHDRLKAVGARVGTQDDVKCCYALQSKLWITDPDGTLWEVYVLHADEPNWGEKDKKVKLLAAPLKAFGLRGVIRRAWNNKFGRRADPAPLDPVAAAVAASASCPVPRA